MRIRSLLANTFLFHIEDLRAINLFYIAQYNIFFHQIIFFQKRMHEHLRGLYFYEYVLFPLLEYLLKKKHGLLYRNQWWHGFKGWA